MDCRYEYLAEMRIRELEAKLEKAREQYSDLLSEYNTLRDTHSRAQGRLDDCKAQWQAEAIRSAIKQGYRSADELESWAAFLGRQAEEAPGPVSPDQEAP